MSGVMSSRSWLAPDIPIMKTTFGAYICITSSRQMIAVIVVVPASIRNMIKLFIRSYSNHRSHTVRILLERLQYITNTYDAVLCSTRI
jgi:hypothetical protein